MKIQLDTTNKTIKIEENVKIDKLISTLKKLLPDNEWKQFTLETNTTINNWTYPITIREYPAYPHYPWYCNGTDLNKEYVSKFKMTAGIFNAEVLC
jgi:hypothetical protein